jgi:hypothetical protein
MVATQIAIHATGEWSIGVLHFEVRKAHQSVYKPHKGEGILWIVEKHPELVLGSLAFNNET